ncbi:MAG: LysR family transcriptional regulator [Rhodobacteraceae bacterium]|nr:MAG: LysR family transcriptional regulator [Paracoccaceae bacterium]
MGLEPWDELRTALHVARAGTVSGAAVTLGVHHATVIRHIDALEDRIAVKLFQRHAKGYTPTEAGRALFEVAKETEQRFEQLAARLQDLQEGISGPLIVTTIPELSAALVPVLAQMRRDYPRLIPCLRTEERVLRLEYGEAHVAVRAGTKPQEPDNVVQSLGALPIALYASAAYLAQHGHPQSDADLTAHRFVGMGEGELRPAAAAWMQMRGVSIGFSSNDHSTRLAAIAAGLGLGFVPQALAQQEGLVQVMGSRPDWSAPLWLVTHVDLHRSPKVQACTRLIRAHLSDWGAASPAA